MATEGEREGSAPYAAAVELPAEKSPEPEPQPTHAPCVRPIGDYERRETTLVEGGGTVKVRVRSRRWLLRVVFLLGRWRR
jgi:hypothetical protein